MAEGIRNPPLLVPNPKVDPSPEAPQQARIVPGSPLAVIGLFVEIIRKRFSPEQNAGYAWNSDIKRTQIAIESGLNEDNDVRNKRPAVFVDRDETVPGRTVLGNFAGQNLFSGKEGFWALATMPITIECIASKKGECAILGDMIQIFLLATGRLIMAKFALHELTPPTLGRVQAFERDKTAYMTPINFSCQYPLRWTNTPVVPLLQEIEASIVASGDSTATSFFERTALKDG